MQKTVRLWHQAGSKQDRPGSRVKETEPRGETLEMAQVAEWAHSHKGG